MPTLTLTHLTKTFPGDIRAVDDLALDVADGELLVLVGPSGCGKTTTLRMIAGLELPTSGSVAIGGADLAGVSPKDRDVAMVFQQGALYPHLSVHGNMAFGLKLRGAGRAEINRRVGEAAAMLDIADLLQRRPWELSGGQRQRVALGRAVVRRPRLFLFDEPLSSLEANLRGQMRQEIRGLHARLGTTMIYVTHDQTEALALGQRIAVLHAGRLQQVADPRTLYERPANRFVAGLIGSPAMNFLEGRIEQREGAVVFVGSGGWGVGGGEERGGRTEEGGGSVVVAIPVERRAELARHVGRPVVLGVRPEHLVLCGAGSEAGGTRIPATVEAIEPAGAESYVYLRAGGYSLVSRMFTDHTLQVHTPVNMAIAVDRVHFFDAESGESLLGNHY